MELDEITGTWGYSSLPENVRIGENCYLERNESFASFRSRRNPGLRIGDRARVYTWTTFNVEPTGYIEVGDDSVLVGPVFMCADSGKRAGGRPLTASAPRDEARGNR